MYKLVGVGGVVRGKSFDLNEGSVIVGRNESATIRLNYDGISKNHFKVSNMNGTLVLEDLDSSNGTFLNEKLVKNQYLKVGDIVSVPGAIFRIVKQKRGSELNRDSVDVGVMHQSFNSKSFEESIKNDNNSILLKLIKRHILKILYDFNGKYRFNGNVSD